MVIKRINFNLKDRKLLMLFLCLVIVSVFTLTIAYAALNAVLTINGNAEVAGSNWDIYLENAVVKNGSATSDVPKITSGKSLSFSTILNMPGDFYEFTVDVVNDGSIDAMIESVIKTPELTAEQAKYLRYEVTYQNGESINAMQVIAAGSMMPIKVRIEYRNDLIASDLPTGQVVLDLSIILNYVQSDGSGSSVLDNGVYIPYKAGRKVCFDSNECFLILYEEGDNVLMLTANNISLTSSPKQSLSLYTTQYSNDTTKGENYNTYEGSIVEGFVNKYNIYLSSIGVVTNEIRLINTTDLITVGCVASGAGGTCGEDLSWLYTFSYWGSTKGGTDHVLTVLNRGVFGRNPYSTKISIRPVINVPKSLVDLYLENE